MAPHADSELYLLNRPPLSEPTRLGAVVEAGWGDRPEQRELWVRAEGDDPLAWYSDEFGWAEWRDLLNPEVKSEGWAGVRHTTFEQELEYRIRTAWPGTVPMSRNLVVPGTWAWPPRV